MIPVIITLNQMWINPALANSAILGSQPLEAQAQVNSDPNPRPPGSTRKPPMMAALEGLDLTPEQTERIRQINQQLRPEFEALRPQPPSPPSEQQQVQMRQLHQKFATQVEAVLTPAQQEQFKANLQKIRPPQN